MVLMEAVRSAERHLREGAAMGGEEHRGLRAGRAHQVSAEGVGAWLKWAWSGCCWGRGQDGGGAAEPLSAVMRCSLACSIHQLRSKVSEEHEVIKKKELESGPKASYGYGGKFGTERDRMDKVTELEGTPLGSLEMSIFCPCFLPMDCLQNVLEPIHIICPC